MSNRKDLRMNPLKFINTLNETETQMARREYIARYVLFFLFIVDFTFTLIAFIVYLFGKMPLDTLIIYSIILIMLFGAIFLTSKGYWRAAGSIPPLFMYFAAVNGNYIGGIDAPGNFLYVLLIMFVAIIYGYRRMWIALGICLATYLCLALMISSGHIIPYRTAETVFINRVVITSGSLVIIALMIWLLGRSYQNELGERIKAEKALRESEESYRTIFENTGTSMIFIEEDMTISMANAEFVRNTGYSQDEVNGRMKWTELVHPDELERMIGQHRLRREISGGALPGYELRYRTKTGDPRDALLNIQLVPGTMKSVASLIDITDRKRAEEALQASDNRLREITTQVPGVVYQLYVRPSGAMGFYYVSDRSELVIGLKPDLEGYFERFSAIIIPEHRDGFIKSIEKSVKESSEWKYEGMLQKPSGEIIWFSCNSNPLLRENEMVFNGVVRDITAQKKAEQELQHSEERYRTLVENASDIVFRTDSTGRFTFVNPAGIHIAGYEEEALMGMHYPELIHPRNLDETIKFFSRQFVKKIKNTYLEYAIITKDGREVWLGQNTQLIVEDGIVKGFQAVSRDITDRKRAEEALRQSEEKYRLIFEHSPLGFLSFDEKGVIVACNDNFVQIIGSSLEKLVGLNMLKLPDKNIVSTVQKALNGSTGLYEGVYSSVTAKKTTPVRVIFDPMISEDGHILGGVGIIEDITVRKQAEESQRILEERLQQADKMEAIGTLAGGIAHDFNNLLMGIQGYASMTLLNLDPTNPNYERLKRIEQQVQSGADLTSQLLGFARGGRYEVKPSNINEIIEKTSSMFGRTKKEISINRKTAKDLWNVEVDRGQMEQVFLNLYVNAWQAMPGGGEIYLETDNVLLNDEQVFPYAIKPGKYVKITITDTGTGMDEKTQERIFDPFFTTKEMGRGTGLGLATVYGIIKGHHGLINVYSETGHGTTFTIYLPASEKEILKEKTPKDEITRGTETILLIDDEQMVMEVNQELLESIGYKVYVAGSGQEGIAVYMEKRDKIDLVILDMIMPGISGSETFDRLREINPNIKVLLSSGYSLNGEAKHIMDRGCNGFLQKPFRLEELSGKVREMLGRLRAEGLSSKLKEIL
jgi:two-component system cell cycle sensor histidine kinase/response regulator CckA